MTAFLIVAALLMGGALLFILPTLLRKEAVVTRHALRDEANLAVLRDQLRELDADLAAGTIDAPGYDSSRKELERRVAEDVQPGVASTDSKGDRRWSAVLLGLAIPVVAVALYLLLGSPDGLDPAQIASKDQAHEVTKQQLIDMVAGLAQRLKDKPDDADGWNMLARSYDTLGQFPEAAAAYAHLVTLVPGNADVLANYADTLAMSRNRSMQGEPEQLIERALLADPSNVKALSLSGSAAFERHDYVAAVKQWKKILLLVPPESDTASTTMSNIGEAQGLAGDPAAAQKPVAKARAAAATEVGGTVELDATLRAKVSGAETVFIFARAAQGPPFPLAVLRKQVKDLPFNFVLDDSMSVISSAKLSSYPMVVVGARISNSGSATPSAGDFEGVTEPVRPGAKHVKILINSQRN